MIALVIGILDILLGFNDNIKELPHKPWGESARDEEPEEEDLEMGTNRDMLNKKKKKHEEREARRKKYELDGSDSDEGEAESSSVSSDSEDIDMSYEAPDGDFYDQGSRWEDNAKTGFSKKRRAKNKAKAESAR
mmetsp:Transcript_13660/g.21392  ORF Transcript_13660/g.21392 Transcript_13660/m.21392 type:complete len:134 (+) Transcript_13660:1038-1439(+)